jgi:hypothetical protein
MRKRWARAVDKFKHIFCAVFGHSNLVVICAQFHVCQRCNEVLGDYANCYRNSLAVEINCDCLRSRLNWERATWVDKFMARKPEWLGYPEANSYNAEQRRMRDEIGVPVWVRK